jgi:retinol-binding protein 3
VKGEIQTMIRAIILFSALSLIAMQHQAQTLDKDPIVKRLAEIMNNNYVYPEKGKEMSDLLIGKLERQEYNHFTNPDELAAELQKDLRSVANDKHIRVAHDPVRVKAIQSQSPSGGRTVPENYGFEEVKILEGNIGYLDLRGFWDISIAEKVAKSSMDKLIKADAIIFDLRKNGGGSPSMIRFICSYLFGKDPVHLNTFYWRPADNYSETWTAPELASETKPNIPIIILTSSYTFSAAEEFTYDLQNLKRATIIGEVTGGGAHPGGPITIDDQFFVNVPQGRAINPVTKTNWEGVGVIPEIKVPANEALEKAFEVLKALDLKKK